MSEDFERAENACSTSAKQGLDRRQLIKAGAWAAPALVLATAAPAVAVSGGGTEPTQSTTGGAWVAAVRTNKSNPGFRFGYQGGTVAVAVAATLKATVAEPGLHFSDLFLSNLAGDWEDVTQSGPVGGLYSYTTTKVLNVGPRNYTAADAMPATGTLGVTLKGRAGEYTAFATATVLYKNHSTAVIELS